MGGRCGVIHFSIPRQFVPNEEPGHSEPLRYIHSDCDVDAIVFEGTYNKRCREGANIDGTGRQHGEMRDE